MDKKAIETYAVWARKELIAQVKQRAYFYGIDEKGYGEKNADVIMGRVLSAKEKSQRNDFIVEIERRGFEQVVEEVAYTWFNRFVALRYMEVNDYLPSHVRVFSESTGRFQPEILQKALHLNLEGLDKTKVAEFLNDNATDELYRYLLLTQCNALNSALPEMFEEIDGYKELLLPNNLLKEDGLLGRLVTDIPEDNWRDAVQIIGWLYQYYNSEPKQEVFDGLKKNIKITKEKIPAATQLFTPDWIVRYMVENSLGRLWLEGHPETDLKSNWEYYLDEAEQTSEVKAQLDKIRKEYRNISPEDIKVIDPCMGSGHILVYAFDVLMQIYRSVGYTDRDAAKLILEKNLYGLDIDKRAYQLSYFALMMKARQYNRRIFSEDVSPQVYHPTGWDDGEEYGSLIRVDDLGEKPQKEVAGSQVGLYEDHERDVRIWNFKRLLAQKYDVVVTNPPYMGSKGMSPKMSDYVKNNYPDSKSDLFSAFIERGLDWIKPTGYNCMVTMQSWMFLSSFETMRKKLLSTRTITNLLHMENMVMGIAFGTAVANLYGQHIADYKGQYNYMTMKDIDDDKPIVFPTAHKRNCTASAENFEKIPGSPVAYWVEGNLAKVYEKGKPINEYSIVFEGLKTRNIQRFLRLWFEVNSPKWKPNAKGGSFRRWYGNNDYVVKWSTNGDEVRSYKQSSGANFAHFFKPTITYSALTSYKFSGRYIDNSIFGGGGGGITNSKITEYLLGFVNSIVFFYLMNIFSQTMNFEVGQIGRQPVLIDKKQDVDALVIANISLSRDDWDSFETSWDFQRHPLVPLYQNITPDTHYGYLRFDDERWLDVIMAGTLSFSCAKNWIAVPPPRGDHLEGVFAHIKKGDYRVEKMVNLLQDDLEIIEDGEFVYLRRYSTLKTPVFSLYGIYDEQIECVQLGNGDFQCKVNFPIEMYNGYEADKMLFIEAGTFDTLLDTDGVVCEKVQYLDKSEEFFIDPSCERKELLYKTRYYNHYDYCKEKEYRLVLPDHSVNDEDRYELSLAGFTDWYKGSFGALSFSLKKPENLLSNWFANLKLKWDKRFKTLKANEEELNCVFIDIYGLQNELTPEVEDKDVTVARIYDKKEDIPASMKGNKYVLTKEDVVKSLISYAVGCMFGRYSLDTEGLAYAGGEWDATKYESFIPDKDNILPISNDEYFEDDIVSRLVEFVRVVYGEETLEENLRFIADALGGTGTSREVIRDYFLKNFFKDHCQTYKKRPIYWLFDSGRKNGFKALIYLHRYQSDLLARMRTDYVHEQQERYRTQLAHIATALNSAEGSERAQLLKRQDKLTGQAEEVIAFEEKIHHLADMNIEMDLDDGVKENYKLFADAVAEI